MATGTRKRGETRTQTDLDAIDQAIKDFHPAGMAQLTFRDQSTTFRSA